MPSVNARAAISHCSASIAVRLCSSKRSMFSLAIQSSGVNRKADRSTSSRFATWFFQRPEVRR